MVFIGFGLQMTFLKRYGYGSIGFNMLLAAYVIEWSILINGWIRMFRTKSYEFTIGVTEYV